jgi:hypothetical protein
MNEITPYQPSQRDFPANQGKPGSSEAMALTDRLIPRSMNSVIRGKSQYSFPPSVYLSMHTGSGPHA